MKRNFLLLATLGTLFLTSCSKNAELGAFLQIPNHASTKGVQQHLRPSESKQAMGYGQANERLTPNVIASAE